MVSVELLVVSSAWFPTASRATSDSPTLTLVCHASVPTMTNCAVLVDVAEDDPVDPVLLPPIPPVLPPAEPLLPEDEPDPVTASPTSTSTVVSRPDTGAVSVAPARSASASSTAVCATSTWAASAATCASEASEPSASSCAFDSDACALARSALAWSSAASSCSVSTVASCCPAVTVSPAATSTEVTVPLTANDTSSWTVGVSVPDAETDCWIVDRLAATAVVVDSGVAACAGASRNPNQYTPVPATPTSSATATTRTHGRVRLHSDSMFSLGPSGTDRARGRVPRGRPGWSGR